MNQQHQQQTPWLKESEVFPFNVDVDVTFPYGPSNYELKDGPFQRQYTCTVDVNGQQWRWSLNYLLHDQLVAQLGLSGGAVIRLKRTKPAQGRAFWTCVNSQGQTVDVEPDVFPQNQEQQNQPQNQQVPPVGGAPAMQPPLAAAPAAPDHSRPIAQSAPAPAPVGGDKAEEMCAAMMYCIENANHMWTASGVEFTSDNVQGTASTMFIQMNMKNISLPTPSPQPAPPPQQPVAQPANAAPFPDDVPAPNDDDLPFS